MNKRGQMKMSFGMIFSIILIIAFLAFAFYAIQKFLSLQENIQIQQFEENLQNDIDKLWQSTSGTKSVEYKLPSKIENICFVTDDFHNMLLYEGIKFTEYKLEHLDIIKTVGNKNSICKKPVKGKINFSLEKTYGEPLVKINLN